MSGGGFTHGQFPLFHETLDRLFETCLLEVSPDVVLIAHLMHHSPSYVFIAHKWSLPVVVELHDFYFACERAHLERVNGDLCDGPAGGKACSQYCFGSSSRSMARWALRSSMFRHALQEAEAVVCPSAFVAQYFSEKFCLRQPPKVIGNGINIGELKPPSYRDRPREPSKALHLASLGVVVPHKGIHIAINALRKARLPRVIYTVFGVVTEPYIQELRALAANVPGLEFKAYGHFEPSDLPFLLSDVDVVVIPSTVWETYSIVAREAMACGVPVVASRVGALAEAVRDGENGLLFEPQNANELAYILQRLAADPSELWRLRDGIRSTDWFLAGERALSLEAILKDVHGRRPRGSTLDEHAELLALRDSLSATDCR